MTTPLLIWGCIVGLLVIILLVRIYSSVRFCLKHKGHLLDFMTEREEFFVPGDPDPRKTEDLLDIDEFDDL